MLPDIFSAQAYVDAVAANYYKYVAAYSAQDPSSPLFQLRQLAAYLNGGNVLCGVYDTSSTAFSLTLDDINKQFSINQGTVRYNSVDYSLSSQRVQYAPLFNTYLTSDYYIATIFIDVVTLNNNALTNLTISQTVNSGDTVVYVREKSTLVTIQTPCRLQIGSTLYQIGSINPYAGTLTLSSATPSITTSAAIDTRVYIIQEPSIGCVYSSNFTASGTVFLADQINRALLPPNCLRLYDVLLQNPASPSVVTSNGTQQIKTCFLNFYGQTYDSTAAQTLIGAIDAFQINHLQSQTYLDLDLALTNFNSATQQYAGSTNVSDYWLNTPLLQPEIISVGVDLGRYKKFDFPDNYLKANKLFGTGNLYELLYAFDPTYYATNNIYSGNTAVSNVSANLLSNYGPASALAPSIAVYGVTATANTSYPSGETPATYQSSSQNVSAGANYGFEIRFTALSSGSYTYYNVYRKSLDNNLSVDLPLSTPQEITGDTNFGSTYMPSQPTSGSENFIGFSGAYTIMSTVGSPGQFAFKFIPRLPTGSLTSKLFVGGVAITMSLSGTYTGNSTLKALLVQPNPDLNTYTTLGTSDAMSINSMTTSPIEYTFKFAQQTTSSLNLTAGSTYYILLQLVASDTTNIAIYGSTSSGPGTLAQGYTGSWGNVPNLAFRFKTLGFVDNLSNSGSQIDKTLPLSNYVFRGIRQIRNTLTKPKAIYAYVPYFKTDANGDNVATSLSNDVLVRVMGYNSTTGTVIDTGYVTVPANTPSGTKIKLTGSNLIDNVTYVNVQPGTSVNVDSNGNVVWSTYDYLLIIGDQ